MRVLSCMVAATSTSAFCPHPRARTRELRDGHSRPSLRLVTESDVMSLVEKAEELWARVERLRNEASDLSAQAESLGREAETSTADAAEKLLRLQSISEEKIREANDAQNLSLDLGALLDRAMSATREADEVEVLAEEAIAASEAALEQYLIDFPEDDEIDAIL
ncbi:hypothetical protein ACHAW5_004226 [Stephanodiscus triporus]|uniref:Uncharacterized protein n=1 Tax=Stephanodiscus triporus TaxID=2934178 RepID=A0ABD3NQL5_9STRA